jgi:hypothetical protein
LLQRETFELRFVQSIQETAYLLFFVRVVAVLRNSENNSLKPDLNTLNPETMTLTSKRIVAPLVAGISTVNVDTEYDEGNTAYEVLCFVTFALCLGLCIFPLSFACK